MNIDRGTLEALYMTKKKSLEEIARELHTSIGNIYHHLKKYEIPIRTRLEAARLRARAKWTEDDEAYLKENFANAPIKELRQRFPDKSKAAIYLKAHKLGVTRPWIRDKAKPSKFLLGQIKEWEKGFIAGIIEGEGSIGIEIKKRSKKTGESLIPVITISNTEIQLLRELQKLLGGRIGITTTYRSSPKWKTVYKMYIYGLKTVLSILEALLPSLISKRERAELVIEFCRSRLNTKRGYTAKQWELAKRVKELNRRGNQ